MQNYPNYYAIITADVRYCPNLSPQEKLLYAEISALASKEGVCFAGNKYFADLYSLTETTISHQLSHLVEEGFIEMSYDKEGGKVKKRYITVAKNRNGTDVLLAKKDNRTVAKNRKDNNTSNINITRLNNINDKSTQLLNMFIAGLKRRNPKIDRTDKQKVHYLGIFDQMLGMYEYREIASMITFAFNSDFWSGIILSADKLLKHHENLYAQAKKYYKIPSDSTDGKVEF